MSDPKAGKPPKLRVIVVNVNGKPRSKKIGDLSSIEQQYFRQLHRLVDEVFSEAYSKYGWTWAGLARNANLSYQTVAKLGDRITRYPAHMTVYKLGRAVGWDIVFQQSKQKLAKAG